MDQHGTLNHLPFVDDVVLITTDILNLKNVSSQLTKAWRKVDLRITLSKIKLTNNAKSIVTKEDTALDTALEQNFKIGLG